MRLHEEGQVRLVDTRARPGTFRQELTELCACLGVRRRILIDRLGPWDDISKDRHRAFVWYSANNSSFRIKGGVVDHLSVPIRDACGRPWLGREDYYSLDGAKLGMTLDQIRRVWQTPDDPADPSAAFGNRVITTADGWRILVGPYFSGGATSARSGAPCDGFWARRHRSQPSKGTFAAVVKWWLG